MHSTQWPALVSQYGVGCAHWVVAEHDGALLGLLAESSPLPQADIPTPIAKSEMVTR